MQAARERVRTGEVTQAVRDAVGRRRRRSARATGSRSSRDGIVATAELAGRRGVRVARQARRRRQRDRHRARRLPTPPPRTPSASASTSRSRSRTSRSSSTTAASRCTPISSAWNSGGRPVPTGDPPLTLRGSPRDPARAAEGRRPRARGPPRRHGPAQRARPAAALSAPLDRPHEEGRHRRARGGRGGDGVRRGAHGPRPPHAQRPGARRGRDPRRHVDAQRHVLQPGVAREAARASAPRCRSSASSTCTAASAR